MECLHRFCGECINKCIRFGMKECPSCRKSIPSRRSLRRDTNFDQLVNSMVGSPFDRNQNDGEQDASKTVHLQKAIIKKKQFMERQKQQRKKQLKIVNTKSNPSSTTHYSAGPKLVNVEQSPLLELELRRHPHEEEVDRLERGFLKLRGDAKVSLLKTFLSCKLEKHEYEISSTFDDDSVVLDDDLSLMDAKETLCSQDDQVMVLKYRVSANDNGKADGYRPAGDATEVAHSREGNHTQHQNSLNGRPANNMHSRKGPEEASIRGATIQKLRHEGRPVKTQKSSNAEYDSSEDDDNLLHDGLKRDRPHLPQRHEEPDV